MIKKFFEAMLNGIKDFVLTLWLGMMHFGLRFVVFLFPTVAMVIIMKYLFKNESDATLAWSITLCIPTMLLGASLVSILQHSHTAGKYAIEHNCDIREAWEATEQTRYLDDDT